MSWRRSSLAASAALAMLAVVAGCSGSNPTPEPTGAQTAEEAIDPTCTLAAAGDPHCDVGWLVQRYAECHASMPNPACGIASCSCPTYAVCWHGPRYDHNQNITLTGDPEVDCSSGTCRRICLVNGTEADTAAAARQAAEFGTAYHVFSIGPWNSSTCHATANITVYNALVHSADPSCGVASWNACAPSGGACPAGATTTYNSCRATSNPFDDGNCGLAAPSTTSAGLTRDQIPVVPHQAIYSASCASCNDLPIDTPAHVQAKAQCLLGNAASRAPSDPEYTREVDELKLLLEVVGDKLSDAQIDSILGLYQSAPGLALACNDTASPPTAAASCGDMPTIDARLLACHRLTLPHATTAAAAALLDRCLAIGAQINAMAAGPTCNGDDFRAFYDTEIAALGKRVVGDAVTALPAQAEVQRRLRLIDHYYRTRRSGRFPAPGQRVQLDQEASAVVGAMWAGLQAYVVAGLDATADAALGTALDGARSATQDIDRTVMLAAFTPDATGSAPLTSAPLLIVTADALHEIEDRAIDVSAFHDTACRWSASRCMPGDGKLSALLSCVGALDVQADLAAALTRGGFAGDGWEAAFVAVRDHHAVLEGAIGDALPGATTLPEALAPSLPPSVTELTGVVGAARTRAQSYAATGLFDATGENLLHAGMDEANVQAVIDDFGDPTGGGVLGNLRAATTAYQAQMTELIHARLTEVDSAGQVATAEARLAAQAQRVLDLEHQVAGLRASAAATSGSLGDFAKNFDTLAASGNIPSDLAVQRAEEVFDLGPWEARFTETTDRTTMRVDALAADPMNAGAPWKRHATAGQTVTLSIDGQWAPTCAIQRTTAPSYAPAPGAPGVTIDFTRIDIQDAFTGPEGWNLQVSGGALHATSYRTFQGGQSTEQTSDSVSTCGSLGAGGTVDILTLNTVTNFCEGASTGTEAHSGSETSESRGLDERTTLSATGGLRLANTPFERLAAGSLVLVQTRPGATTWQDIIGLTVVQPHATVMIHQDADLYLVVNDLKNDACGIVDAASTARLHVNAVISTPFGAMARTISNAMVAALDGIETEAAGQNYLDQGRLLPEQDAHLHDLANQKLQDACQGCNLALLPALARNLFDMHINAAITRLALTLEAETIEHEMHVASLDADTITRDLTRTQSVGRMARLASTWSLRNLDGEALRLPVRAVNELAIHQMYPVMHLRYPGQLASIQSTAASQLAALRTVDWTTPVLIVAQQLTDLATVIRTGITGAMHGSQVPATDIVVLRFPRPGSPDQPTAWRTADPARAKAMWDSIPTGTLQFSITPDDLYNAPASTLACTESVPIIRSMMLFEMVPDGLAPGLNAWGYAPPMVTGERMDFAGRAAAETYGIPDDWRTHTVHLRFGSSYLDPLDQDPSDSTQNLPALHASSASRGLTPFGRFTVDLRQLLPPNNPAGSPFDVGTDLLVMIELETTSVASPGLTWIATCLPGGS